MADVGPARRADLRNRLFRHILDQSAAFFSQTDVRSARVAHHERRQPGAGGGLGDAGRSGARVPRRRRLRRAICSTSTGAWRSSCMTAAPLVVYPLVRLGQRVRRTTRRGPGGARARHAPRDRGLHRPPHRQGVRRRGARSDALRARRRDQLYRTNMKITGAVSALPPLMEFIGGLAAVGALGTARSKIAAGDADAGRVHGVPGRRVHDVRADQEAEPRERQPPAGDCRVRAHLRDARHAHRSARAARRAGAARRCRRRVEFRDVGFAYDDRPGPVRPAPRVASRSRAGQVVGARRAERRRQDDARESDSAVLRRHRGRAS